MKQTSGSEETLTVGSDCKLLVESRVADDIQMKSLLEAYKAGYDFNYLEFVELNAPKPEGTAEKKDKMNMTPCSTAGILWAISDVSADVNDASLDFSGYSKYRFTDTKGNTIYWDTPDQQWYANMDVLINKSAVPTSFFNRKNIQITPTGCGNIYDTLTTGTHNGSHKLSTSDMINVTSSDSNADKLIAYQIIHRHGHIKNGICDATIDLV
jgi:hypothetical protein